MAIRKRFVPSLKKTLEDQWNSRDVKHAGELNAWEELPDLQIGLVTPSSLVESALIDHYGEKGKTEDCGPGCVHCAAWREYGILKRSQNLKKNIIIPLLPK